MLIGRNSPERNTKLKSTAGDGITLFKTIIGKNDNRKDANFGPLLTKECVINGFVSQWSFSLTQFPKIVLVQNKSPVSDGNRLVSSSVLRHPSIQQKKWYCIFKTRSRTIDKSIVHGFAYSQKHANRQYSDVRGQTVTLTPWQRSKQLVFWRCWQLAFRDVIKKWASFEPR